MNLKVRDLKIINVLLFCMLLHSCTNSPKNIPFPSNETEFKVPEKVKLGKPEIVICNPLVVPLGVGRPDSLLPPLKTKLGLPNVVPFLDNSKNLEAPKINPLSSPNKIKLHDVTTIICKAKSVLLGQAEKVICKPAKTADNAINNLKFYSQDQGLVATVAQCMCYDELGNLWVGTDGGLCKFDGQRWWIYTTAQGLTSNYIFSLGLSSNGHLLVGTSGGGMNIIDFKKQEVKQFTKAQGICSNSIKCVLERKDGKLFVGTGTGLELLDISNSTLKHYGKEQGFTNGKIRSVSENSKGKFLIGTAGGGLLVMDDKKNEIEVYGAEQGFTTNFIRCVIETKDKNFLIGTNENGLDYVDFKNSKVKNYGLAQGLCDDHIISMMLRNNGDLVIGTFGGGMDILKLDSQLGFEEEGILIENYNVNKGLSSNIVVSLLEGKDRNLLIGTEGGGLNILDNTNQDLFHYAKEQGLSNNFVFSIIENDKRKLVVGTDGGGFNIIDEKNKTIEQYTTSQGLSNDYLRSLYESKDGKLIVGTDGNGIDILSLGDKVADRTITHFDATNGLCNNSVFSLHQSVYGSLFIGTLGGGMDELDLDKNVIKHYTVKQGLSSNKVISVFELKDRSLLIATSGGGINILNLATHELKKYSTKQGIANEEVNCVYESSDGILFVGTDGGGLDIVNLKREEIINYSTRNGLPNGQVTCIEEDSLGVIWLGTGKGLCKLIKVNSDYFIQKHFDKREGLKYMDFNNKAIKYTKSGNLWAGVGDVLTKFNPYISIDTTKPSVYITNVDVMEQKESWDTKNRILSRLNSKDTVWTSTLDTFFVKDKMPEETSYFGKYNINYSATEENIFHLPIDLVLPSSQNHLAFQYSGICIAANNDRLRYRYILDGLDKHWSPITEKFEADYRNIPPGNYVFKVAARNVNGFWSKPAEFKFKVSPPWYRHPMAYVGYVIGFLSIMFGFNGVRTRQLMLRQQFLEKTVEERTAEVLEEKKIVEEQKHLIEEKHKEITDSINYAERIQRSFLATKELLDKNLDEYFVLFKPKDVVSGDFYWAGALGNEKFALATADSTGHGVPGAIMSLLNITSIEGAIKDGHKEPSEILNSTRKTIIERLKKDGSAEGGKDGMDCSLCLYDFKNKKLSIAAANNPVWIVRRNEVIEIKADKMPVGKHDRDSISFTQQEIDLQTGDVVYTLTDGFPDQFGGEKGKKFMSKNLRELLVTIAHLPMQEQKELLERAFADWVGNMEQVDDVTLIGIRV